MDLYDIIKFLHVAASILWLGGAFSLVLLGILADRAGDAARLRSTMQQVGIVAPRVFVPGTVAVLVLGLLLVWTGGLAWEAWNLLALLGILVTGGLGAFVLSPLAEKANRHFAEGREGEGVRDSRRCLALARLDLAMLFAIVFLMVVKPGWTDWPALLVAALAVGLGALSLRRPGRGAPALPA